MPSVYKHFFLVLFAAVFISVGSGVTSVYLFRAISERSPVAEEKQVVPSPTLPPDIRSKMGEASTNQFSRALVQEETQIESGTLVKLFYPEQLGTEPSSLKWEDLPPEEQNGVMEIWFFEGSRAVLLDTQYSYGSCGSLDWYYDTTDRSIATIKRNGCGFNNYQDHTITIYNSAGGKMATLYQGPSMGKEYNDSGNLYILFEGFSHTIYHIMADVDTAGCHEGEKNVSKFLGITITSLRNGVTNSKKLPLANGSFSCAMGPARLSPMSFYDDIISFATPVGDMVYIDLQALYDSAMQDTDWTQSEKAFRVEKVK